MAMTWIALASYRRQDRLAPALVHDDHLYDLEEVAKTGVAAPPKEWLIGGVATMLVDWDRCSRWLREAAPLLAAAIQCKSIQAVPDGKSRLGAPFRPERIFCAASNYIEHANEMGTALAAKAESKPYMFLKLRNTVIGPGEPIQMPPETSKLDWEIELGAVIGKQCRRIPVERALDAIAGYTVVNDVSARDLNERSDYPFKFDWFQGKCHDTFAPLGPWIVPAWQVKDPQAVHLHLEVNGQTMQEDTTANMIWAVREQISYLSTIVTLEPGDVVATGTPTGVGMGRGIFLKDGDRIEAAVRGIGTLTNAVKAEAIAKSFA